tara:strand:- start:861 stop:1055 length:195 start_codon:yes stop_codon:yes gene_type:complete
MPRNILPIKKSVEEVKLELSQLKAEVDKMWIYIKKLNDTVFNEDLGVLIDTIEEIEPVSKGWWW